MEDFVFRIVNLAYRMVFRESLTPEVKRFLKSVLYIGLGSGIAAIFAFVFNILAGRVLGPSSYGEFALVLSVGSLLVIPMRFMEAPLIKYNSEKNEIDRQRRIISTTFILVLIFSLAFIFTYFIFSSSLSGVFSVSSWIFKLSIFFALCYVLFTLPCATLQSLFQMKRLAISQSLFGAISMLALVVAFLILNSANFEAAVFSVLAGYILIGGIILFSRHKYISAGFDRQWAVRLLRYGMYSLLAGACSAIHLNISKILINKYMTTTDVGIYNAYYFTSVQVLCFFALAFTTVLFPTASAYRSKVDIFNKINRIIPFLVVLGIPALFGGQYLFLKLYGGGYPFDPLLSVLFAVASITIAIYIIYGQLMNSVGRRGVRTTALAMAVLAASVILLSILLIPLLGIKGAVVALIISYALFLLIILWRRGLFYERADVAKGSD